MIEIIKIIKNIDDYKIIVYTILLFIYFLLYYLITVPQLSEELTYVNQLNKKIWVIVILVIINILSIGLIYIKLSNIVLSIFIFSVLIFLNILLFGNKLLTVSSSLITKYLFIIFSSIFYIIYITLFFYNINSKINIEIYIAIEILLLLLCGYIFITFINIKKINYQLKHNDFSTLTINCFKEHNTKVNIHEQYSDDYLKTNGNIPISFYNKTLNNYQDLVLADFYYPGSYYSYLADTPLNGTPNLEALKICLTEFKTRIIHLDVYSDKSDPYDPNALPIIKCENMKDGATPLSFDDTMGLINKFAWINDNPNNLSYPLFLYLNFNFNEDNENIYIRIYEKLLKFFSKNLVDKKYSFSGRNNIFPISSAKIKDCLNKIIIVTNIYPTKTVLDELINSSSNHLNNTFNLNVYKESYITYEKQGLSQDNDKNVVLNNAKSTLNFYYTLPNDSYKNNNQNKAGLYNPSFQDCAQYGIQGTLMYVFIPDDNLNKWKSFFKTKNNLNPVLKDESLRLVNNLTVEIKKQDPVLGLQKPQKYCLIPGVLSTEKSNLSDSTANSSCQ